MARFWIVQHGQSADNVTRDALRKFSGRENLEERWFEDARIDRVVLDFMRKKLKG